MREYRSSRAENVTAENDPGAETADVLIAMLAARDGLAGDHARAVAHWTRRLCSEMQLSHQAADFVALCALLHDIGFVSTPDAVLHKQSELSGAESEIVRDHAAAGERILRGIAGLERCADVVRSHHERWDGAGYPDGISGSSIPLESRVIAVADAFQAMISGRPYRAAMAPRLALDLLVEGRGVQWDPQVVDALLAIFRHAQPVRPSKAQVSSAHVTSEESVRVWARGAVPKRRL